MVHVLLYLSKIEILYVSVLHNAAGPQNNVSSESSFATKSALFGPKNVCPFQILDLTLYALRLRRKRPGVELGSLCTNFRDIKVVTNVYKL